MLSNLSDLGMLSMSQRNTHAIKSDLLGLSQQLSSGQIADVSRSLAGETMMFSALQNDLQRVAGFQRATEDMGQTLAQVQVVLDDVDTTRILAMDRLLRVNEASSAPQIEEAAVAARDVLDQMVRALNTQLGGRSLMAGQSVDQAPLADAQTMLDSIVLAIGGATDAASITAAVDAWFDDPAGGFETVAYQGSVMDRSIRVADNRDISIDVRADDPALRTTMKGAALAALVQDLGPLPIETQRTLLQDAGQGLFAAGADMGLLQARVGYTQGAVETVRVELETKETGLRMAENDVASADPFETATQLEAVQLQLEMHFSTLSRLSQLSFTRFI